MKQESAWWQKRSHFKIKNVWNVSNPNKSTAKNESYPCLRFTALKNKCIILHHIRHAHACGLHVLTWVPLPDSHVHAQHCNYFISKKKKKNWQVSLLGSGYSKPLLLPPWLALLILVKACGWDIEPLARLWLHSEKPMYINAPDIIATRHHFPVEPGLSLR